MRTVFLMVLAGSFLLSCRPPSEATSDATVIVPPPPVYTVGVGDIVDDAIETVKFGASELGFSEPIVDLGSFNTLELSFDVLGEGVREFRYRIVHCDRNWLPSGLNELEYIQGFTEADITNYALAFNTLRPYVHYELTLPNRDMQWTLSGNYLLEIFDRSTYDPVMRLRFIVVEPLLNLQVFSTRPSVVSLDRTHHEFDVVVPTEGVVLDNPRRSLSLTAIQNGDWRTAIYNVPVRLLRQTDVLFDYQGRILFPALRDWRPLDLRTLQATNNSRLEISQDQDGFLVYLAPDLMRKGQTFTTFTDLNGDFVVESFDHVQVDLQGEYAEVVFALAADPDSLSAPPYLYGAITQYRLDDTNRGIYNELTQQWMFKTTVKEGYYDYAYVTVPPGAVVPDWSEIEGNNFQTENSYRFLLYYRPLGARYDRIIGQQFLQLNR